MCGIAGLWVQGGAEQASLETRAGAMTNALRHRGPDDHGIWTDERSGIALGQQRLSIIDLSPAGHQPMESSDGRYVITYNGEIYNYLDLRRDLIARGSQFRGHSDTEIILECCVHFGIEETLKRLNGMFAIALWDGKERRLHLCRDRLGEKPLYWCKFGNLVLFGSELKALRADRSWTPRMNDGAVGAFLRHNYIPAPHTIYSGVHKVEPGAVIILGENQDPKREIYWSQHGAVAQGRDNRKDISEAEAADELEALLSDAVSRRMIADVPLGAFLSGGYDSSTIVALMQKASPRPIKTFTIGFEDAAFDEAPHAEAVARHLGTEHISFPVTGADALAVVPKLPKMYDEPFADSSQIPTHLVSALTRKHVTVALSGDGGDELFSGYNRYQWAERVWKPFSWAPYPLRQAGASAIRSLPQSFYDALFAYAPGTGKIRQAGHKAHRVADIISVPSIDEVYRRLVSHTDKPNELLSSGGEVRGAAWDENLLSLLPDPIDRMRYLDLCTYLPDDILTKVDRASMATALEVRVPFLDHRVVEWVWRLPARLNARAPRPKHLLRQVLARYVPPSLSDRPKMGFGVPLGDWMRGPLREWAEDLLSASSLRDGPLRAEPVRAAWAAHLGGSNNHQYLLWNVLMLQAWRREWDTAQTETSAGVLPSQ